MPVFVVTAPDGKKYKVTAPDGATQDEVMARVQAQHSAPAEKPTSFWQGVAEGVYKPVSNMAHLLTEGAGPIGKAIDAGVSLIDSYQHQGVEASPNQGSTAGKIVGNVIGTLPLSSGGAFASGVVSGAALTPDVKNPAGLARDALIGGVTSKAADMAIGGVAKVARKVKKPTAVIPDAAQVVKAGQDAGVRVFTTDVKPPSSGIGKTIKQAFPENIPLTGMAGPRAAQQGERVAAAKALLDEYGGEQATSLFDDTYHQAINSVAEDLAKQRGSRITALKTVKDGIIDNIGGQVPVPNATQAIDTEIGRLQSLGSSEVAPAVAKLSEWKNALQGKDLRGIEDFRKAIVGPAYKDPNLGSIQGTAQQAFNKVYGALRQDMGDYIKTQAGNGTAARWADANGKLSAMAGELDSNAFAKVLNETDITPENVQKLLFSKNPSDVKRVVSNLSLDGLAKAKTAIVQKAFDKSISTDGGLSVERFANNLKATAKPMGVIFDPVEQARIDGLTRLLDVTRRAAQSMASPATGQRLTLPVIGAYLGQAMGFAGSLATMGASGLMARLYEAPATRDLMVRLARTPAGSQAERTIFKKILEAGAVVGAKELKAFNDNVGVPVAASPGQTQENQQQQQPALQP